MGYDLVKHQVSFTDPRPVRTPINRDLRIATTGGIFTETAPYQTGLRQALIKTWQRFIRYTKLKGEVFIMKISSKRLEVQYYLCTNNNVPRGTFEPREVRSAEIRTLRLNF